MLTYTSHCARFMGAVMALSLLVISAAGAVSAPGDAAADDLVALMKETGRPYAAIGRVISPPAIDGQGDDETWEKAVILRPFFTGDMSEIPSATTTAWLGWDDEHLYVRFHCEEPILEERRNRLEDFHRAITQDDTAVWEDQCVVLLIARPDGEYVYDFFFNANGALADARGELPDPWSSRDASFDTGAQVDASVSEGAWEAELAVPWPALGGPPDETPWRICLGRLRRAISETSAWRAPTDRGLHDVNSFGYARFVDEPISLQVTPPQKLQPGTNSASFQADPAMLPLAISANLRAPDADDVTRHVELWDAGSTRDMSFTSDLRGDVDFTLNVWDTESGTPFYLSPTMKRTIEKSRGTISIRTEGGWKVTLGGETIADGTGAADDVAIPFQEGINVLAITFEGGTGSFAGQFHGIPLNSDDTWVMAAGDLPEKFHAADFDTSSMERARVIGDSELEGASQVGADSGPVTLRKTILWRYTRVNPKPSPAYFLAKNLPESMNIPEPGLPGCKLEDYTLHLALPEGIELLGTSGFYGALIDYLPLYSTEEAGTIELDGRTYRHILVTADQPVTHRTSSLILTEIDLHLKATDPLAAGDSSRLVLWSNAENGAVMEVPQTVPLQVVQSVEGRQPENVRILMWTSYMRRLDVPDLRETVLDTFQTAGVNWISHPDGPDVAGKRNINRMEHMRFWSWNELKEYAEAHPEAALVDAGGNRSKELLSPAFILGDGWPVFEEALRERLLEFKPQALMWDAETNAFTGYMASYDETSLQQFAEFAGLDADNLTRESIRDQHGDEWVAFTNDRLAQLCLKAKEALSEILPNATFWVYSGYQSERTRSRYSVDWARLAELDAIDVASCGYGRKIDAVRATQRAIGDIPLVTGVNLAAYRRTEDKAVRPLTKATLLRRLTDGTGGILIYNHPQMEGRSYHALGEITRLVADHDGIFTQGRLDRNWHGLGEENHPDTAVLKSPDGYLLAVMNESDEPRTYTMTLPDRAFERGYEYYSGQSFDSGDTISVTLQPHDAAAYILK